MRNIAYGIQSLWIAGAMLLTSTWAWAQSDESSTAEVNVPQNLGDVAKDQIETAKNLVNMIIEFFVKYSFQVMGGFIVLVVGWIVAGYITKFALGLLDKYKVDVTVSKFIGHVVRIMIMTFAVIVALGKFGIEIAPLIAGISVLGVGVSFALQGPLSNMAAGASLIFTKPFKVGEIIEVSGVFGEISDIKLLRTEMITVDGNKIVIPNNKIIGEIIHNYSNFKRIDITVGVSYSSNIDQAIEIVRSVIKQDERVNVAKEPKVGITEFADSSVNIFARFWCLQKEYWDVQFAVNKAIFDEFAKNNIEIPFPQRDIHLYKEDK